SRSALRFERVLLFPRTNHVDQNIVPWARDCLEWRPDTAFVGEFNKLPAHDFEERVPPARGRCFGMHDFAATKKHQTALCFFNHLERAVAPAETTHLQNIDHMEKIGRIRRRVPGPLDRAQQIVSFYWLGKNLGLANFQSPLRRGIIGKKQYLERWENFTER